MVKRILSVLIVSLLLTAFGSVASAQNAPDAVREAAIAAAQNALGITSRPTNWVWQFDPGATTTALGCNRVSGTALPTSISYYIFTLTFGGQEYRVHVSADAQYVQLCDEKFDNLSSADGTPTPVVPTCTLDVSALTTLYTLPDFSSTGITTRAAGDTLTAYGRSSDSNWYQVAVPGGSGVGWVSLTTVVAPFSCQSLPIKATVGDTVTGSDTCFLAPASTYSNVRSQPDVNATQVDTIFEGTTWQVFARNSDNSWFYIESGWVAASVATLSGSCDSIPVDVSLVGSGSSQPSATTVAPTPLGLGLVTGIPTDAVCPASYTGYMTPRIQIGQGTASVVSGGLPNRIREQPNTQANQIGQINPGRTIDRVLNGPACNQGYVWWLVEADGVTGWTAESNSDGEDYYLDPTGEPATPQAQVEADDVPHASLEINAYASSIAIDSSGGYMALTVPYIEGGEMFDEQPSEILIAEIPADATTATPAPTSLTAEDAIVVSAMPDGLFAVLGADGVLHQINVAGTESNSVSGIEVTEQQPAVDFNNSGSLMLVPGCNEIDETGACTQGRIDLWDAVEGTIIRRQPAHIDVPAVAFSPNDQIIASAAADGVQFWDLQSGGFLGAVVNEGNGDINDIAFSPDGTLLIYGTCQLNAEDICMDGRVGIVNVTSFELVVGSPIADHTDIVHSVAFSGDGSMWASAGQDGQILVYDTTTGERLYTLAQEDMTVQQIEFGGEDGVTLVAMSYPIGDSPFTSVTFWPLQAPNPEG
ncbi:MAG: hypothetical protein CL607_08950 [Anaerolineaceae bacterium]|nr:hypothetical protein [Anaerolineaceae bacterium]